MEKAKTIFASSGERSAFEAITSYLPQGWALYPNVAFPQVVKARKAELKNGEWNFYLKTSVDFVLTDPSGELSLVIEFDGLGEGFSLGDSYHQSQATCDPHRKLKLDFKLRLCCAVKLPFLIISSEETRIIKIREARRLIHSIIGQHIASRVYRETIRRWDEEGLGAGKSPDDVFRESVGLRTDLQFRFDPFLAGLHRQYDGISRLGIRSSFEFLFDPDVSTAMRTNQPFNSVGCRYTANAGILMSPVIQVVWVRNFAGRELAGMLIPELPISTGVNPLQVAQNVAWYLGQERVMAATNSDGYTK